MKIIIAEINNDKYILSIDEFLIKQNIISEETIGQTKLNIL